MSVEQHEAGRDRAEPLLDFPLSRRGDVLPEECAWLREKAPVARVRTLTGDPAWLVSSYALAKQVLEDERFSLKDTARPGVPRQYALTILTPSWPRAGPQTSGRGSSTPSRRRCTAGCWGCRSRTGGA